MIDFLYYIALVLLVAVSGFTWMVSSQGVWLYFTCRHLFVTKTRVALTLYLAAAVVSTAALLTLIL